MSHLLLGMLLLVQGAGHLMSGTQLRITLGPGRGVRPNVITEFPSIRRLGDGPLYLSGFPKFDNPFCMLSFVFLYKIQTNLFILYICTYM